MKLIINKEIQSRNKFVGKHWTIKHNDSIKWEKEIRNAYFISEYSLPIPKAKKKKKLDIVSCRKRKLDYDNLVGGAKGLIDALRRLGMIVDDSPNWLDVSYKQKTDSKKWPQTILELD